MDIMNSLIKGIAKKTPLVRRVLYQRDQAIIERNEALRNLDQISKLFVSPGHFYSPVTSRDDIEGYERKLARTSGDILGVDLNEAEQLGLLDKLKRYYQELPFHPNKSDQLRYYYENQNYSYSDGIFLYSMIRHLKPKNIIEIGSGFSSCVMLDTNDLFFNKSISCTFIEPYPELLLTLVKEEDKENARVIVSKLQDVDLNQFSVLGENDILFIDSTHVSKLNSDVNYIFFELLPSLNKGVYIHIHDIFFPFEYPKEWIYQGRSWNEMYLLRAFLQYNRSFKIVIFNTFLEEKHQELFLKEMPLCMKNKGGSIWLQKI